MKLAILQANLGGYDVPHPWPDLIVPPCVELSVRRLTDENFPPRPLAMTSRLQCGIPKWFGPQFAPDADVLIWIDASCVPTPGAVGWFLDKLGHADIAVFKHPERNTVREEHEFVKARMSRPGEKYLNSRYAGEDLDGQYAYIQAKGKEELPLYATTAFVYRPVSAVRHAFEQVWIGKSRFLLHDQLVFPFALHASIWRVDVNVIPDNYLKCPALEFVRKGKRTRH